jgi:hypothetical protein
VFVTTLFANDTSARARHGEGGMMLQAMNFDYICKHVGIRGVGNGGQKNKGTMKQWTGNSLVPASYCLPIFIPHSRSNYILAAAACTARLT